MRVLNSDFLRRETHRSASSSSSSQSQAQSQSRSKTCVILLNYHLPRCTEYLWRQASTRVCADGGATRLRRLGIENCPPPHFIVGDLDSVSTEDVDYFANQGTTVVDLSHDQDTTDLDKCYRIVQERTDLDAERDAIVILGAFGGKWDREMSNLHVMMKYPNITNAILVGDESHARVLSRGKNQIILDFELEGPGCSLIPLGHECSVTTNGLKWNLNNQCLSFGHLVSTSNVAEQNQVIVETDQPLIWTVDSNL